MLLAVAALVVGLVVLTFAADWFVEGAARIAAELRLSAVVIGAVIIGFGTSLPELVVSAVAAYRDSLDIAVGNIIGSNVANLSLVLGAAALLTPIVIASPTLKREVPLSTAAVVAFAIAVQDRLGVVEGSVLAAALLLSAFVLVRGARDPADVLGADTTEFLEDGRSHDLRRETARTVVGLVGTLAGAQTIVWGAQYIAGELGIAEGFVGFTLVAVGTSLPELVTSVQAARKGEVDLIVGNLLGSNLLNSLFVGGFVGILGPDLLADPTLTGLPVVFMVAVAVVAAVMMLTGRRVSRPEGIALLAAYAAALPLLPR